MLLAALLIRLGIGAGAFAPGYVSVTELVVAVPGSGPLVGGIAMLVSALYAMNLLLLVLNLIPVPPLDGSAVIGLVLPEETVRKLQSTVNQSGLGLIGLLVAFVAIREGFWPIFVATLGVLFAGV